MEAVLILWVECCHQKSVINLWETKCLKRISKYIPLNIWLVNFMYQKIGLTNTKCDGHSTLQNKGEAAFEKTIETANPDEVLNLIYDVG